LSELYTVNLQINMVKYDVDREIMNIYENFQIVWSHFFTKVILNYSPLPNADLILPKRLFAECHYAELHFT
jgi:hypothetical protein